MAVLVARDLARGDHRLHFAAFDRLYKAYQEFLQGLFISRRTYPLAYNKWIRDQVSDRLGLPDLYAKLPTILQIACLESDEILTKADLLEALLDTGTVQPQ